MDGEQLARSPSQPILSGVVRRRAAGSGALPCCRCARRAGWQQSAAAVPAAATAAVRCESCSESRHNKRIFDRPRGTVAQLDAGHSCRHRRSVRQMAAPGPSGASDVPEEGYLDRAARAEPPRCKDSGIHTPWRLLLLVLGPRLHGGRLGELQDACMCHQHVYCSCLCRPHSRSLRAYLAHMISGPQTMHSVAR